MHHKHDKIKIILLSIFGREILKLRFFFKARLELDVAHLLTKLAMGLPISFGSPSSLSETLEDPGGSGGGAVSDGKSAVFSDGLEPLERRLSTSAICSRFFRYSS